MAESTELLDIEYEEREGSRMILDRPQDPQGQEICLIYLHIFNT